MQRSHLAAGALQCPAANALGPVGQFDHSQFETDISLFETDISLFETDISQCQTDISQCVSGVQALDHSFTYTECARAQS